jgi:hypothetical protein
VNSNLPLFDDPPSLDRSALAGKLAALAKANIFVGTSSWRYPGWLGTIYTPSVTCIGANGEETI